MANRPARRFALSLHEDGERSQGAELRNLPAPSFDAEIRDLEWRQIMRHAQGTHRAAGTMPVRATRATATICGFAILSLVTVLGVSLASDAADATGDEAPVYLVTRPAAVATARPFDGPGCIAMAACRPAEAR